MAEPASPQGAQHGGARRGAGHHSKRMADRRMIFPSRVHPSTLEALRQDRRVGEKTLGQTLDRWVAERKA